MKRSPLECIINDANLEQKPVTLQVLKINTRATAFYQRLGFTIVDENATHFQKVEASRNAEGSRNPDI